MQSVYSVPSVYHHCTVSVPSVCSQCMIHLYSQYIQSVYTVSEYSQCIQSVHVDPIQSVCTVSLYNQCIQSLSTLILAYFMPISMRVYCFLPTTLSSIVCLHNLNAPIEMQRCGNASTRSHQSSNTDIQPSGQMPITCDLMNQNLT